MATQHTRCGYLLQILGGIASLYFIVQNVSNPSYPLPSAGGIWTYAEWLLNPKAWRIWILVLGVMLFIVGTKLKRRGRIPVPDMTVLDAANFVLMETPTGGKKDRAWVLERIKEAAGNGKVSVWGGADNTLIPVESLKSDRYAFKAGTGCGDWFCMRQGGPLVDSYVDTVDGKQKEIHEPVWVGPMVCRWQIENEFPKYNFVRRVWRKSTA